MLEMMKANRIFDKKLEYNYHKSFKEKENNDIQRTFKYSYSYDKKTIVSIKKLVKNSTSGSLNIKCRWAMLLSFFYFKLHLKSVASMLRKFKIR